jgi:hypothetical protein
VTADGGSEASVVSRRRFLQLVAGAAAATAATAVPAVVGPQEAAALGGLVLFTAGFPRVFVFRQSEILAQQRDYATWAAAFVPFGGIEGKVLPEERSDTVSSRNLEYFTRFKREHPDKFVLVHLDGAGRLPEFETTGWWAGAWLYKAGTVLTRAAAAADTVLAVASTAAFHLVPDRFGQVWSDIVVCPADGTGAPDLRTAEHCRVTGIDAAAGTVTVDRGVYGSAALDFAAGAYVAEHVAAASVVAGGNKKWLYNFATIAPTDPAGHSVIDLIVAGLAPRFARGGELAGLDGIELDLFSIAGVERAGADADVDGVADDAMVAGQDAYELGLMAFTTRLRTVLGTARVLVTDGGGAQRPPQAAVNGVEQEGFPSIIDDSFRTWSQALNIAQFWSQHGRSPRLSYPMFKLADWVPDRSRFGQFRLALAGSLLTGTLFTFYNEPAAGSCDGLAAGPNSGHFTNQFTVWDELVAGQEAAPGWLGQPLGATVHLASGGADIFGGAGVALTPSFLSHVQGPHVQVKRVAVAGQPVASITTTTSDPLLVNLNGIAVTGTDLVVTLDIAADSPTGYPANEPRRLLVAPYTSVTAPFTQQCLVGPTFASVVLYFRGVGPATVTIAFVLDGNLRVRFRAIRAFAAPDACYRLFDHGAVFANPSRNAVPFDLSALAPGQSFRRLRGTAGQDPITNDGSPLGASVTIPALDALIVQTVA